MNFEHTICDLRNWNVEIENIMLEMVKDIGACAFSGSTAEEEWGSNVHLR